MEISRKQAAKMIADGAYPFSDMNGTDYLMMAGMIFTIKDDLDADEKKAQAEASKEQNL